MEGFIPARLKLTALIDKLFADTVVICHHEKLFTGLFSLFFGGLNL